MKVFDMTRTGLIVTIAVIGLMCYDLAAVLIGGTGSSVSNFLINVVHLSPVICFGLGWVCCHLIGGQMFERPTKKDEPIDLSQVKK